MVKLHKKIKKAILYGKITIIQREKYWIQKLDTKIPRGLNPGIKTKTMTVLNIVLKAEW